MRSIRRDTTLNDEENLEKSGTMMGREAKGEEGALTCGVLANIYFRISIHIS